MDLLLTEQERCRFADWLEHEAVVAAGMAAQMETLGPHGVLVAEREKRYASAAAFIAARLRATESMSIG